MKGSTSCRICGHWTEGDYNTAPPGIEGDEQRALAEIKMARGFCSKASCVLEALRRDTERQRRHLQILPQ